tara:strand:+ start:334 stop:678 length:345 start_codon:yes stop_codon:yes gene_type:complete
MKIDIEKHMRDQQIKEIIKNYYKDTDVVVTFEDVNYMDTTTGYYDIPAKHINITKGTYGVLISVKDWVSWRIDGKLAQNVFPYMSVDQREFLITGMTPTDWNALSNGEASLVLV